MTQQVKKRFKILLFVQNQRANHPLRLYVCSFLIVCVLIAAIALIPFAFSASYKTYPKNNLNIELTPIVFDSEKQSFLTDTLAKSEADILNFNDDGSFEYFYAGTGFGVCTLDKDGAIETAKSFLKKANLLPPDDQYVVSVSSVKQSPMAVISDVESAAPASQVVKYDVTFFPTVNEYKIVSLENPARITVKISGDKVIGIYYRWDNIAVTEAEEQPPIISEEDMRTKNNSLFEECFEGTDDLNVYFTYFAENNITKRAWAVTDNTDVMLIDAENGECLYDPRND